MCIVALSCFFTYLLISLQCVTNTKEKKRDKRYHYHRITFTGRDGRDNGVKIS